jgi:hypothetical protein
VIWKTLCIHQRCNRKNTPIPTIPKVVPPEPATKPAVQPQPRLSTRTRAPKSLIYVSQAAIYNFLGSALEDNTQIYTPLSIQKLRKDNRLCEIEHTCNGVVHPVTGKTTTKYKTLIKDPLTRLVWSRAMCKELGRLAQGYLGEKGTNTVRYLDHEQIRNIPKYCVVTYARIVVDYLAQKEDPNRASITAGGNLIMYPYELTTWMADLVTTKIVWNSVLAPRLQNTCV